MYEAALLIEDFRGCDAYRQQMHDTLDESLDISAQLIGLTRASLTASE